MRGVGAGTWGSGRRVAAVLAVAAVGLVVTGMRAPAAHACSCTALTHASLGNRAAAADAAVIAHLRDGVPVDADGGSGGVDVSLEVEVDEVVRGDLGPGPVAVRASSCSVEVPAGPVGLVLNRRQDEWRLDTCGRVEDAAALRAAPWRAPAATGAGPLTTVLAGRFGEAVLVGLDATGAVVRTATGSGEVVAVGLCPDAAVIATVVSAGAVEPSRVVVRALPGLEVLWQTTVVGWNADDRLGPARTSVACTDAGRTALVTRGVDGAPVGAVVRMGETSPLSGATWVAGNGAATVATNRGGTALVDVDPATGTVAARPDLPGGWLGWRVALAPDGTAAVLARHADQVAGTAAALLLVPPKGDDHEPTVVPIAVDDVRLLRWVDPDHVEVSFGAPARRQVIARDGNPGPVEPADAPQPARGPATDPLGAPVRFTAGAHTFAVDLEERLAPDAGGAAVLPVADVRDVATLSTALPVLAGSADPPRDAPSTTAPRAPEVLAVSSGTEDDGFPWVWAAVALAVFVVVDAVVLTKVLRRRR